MNEKVSEDLLFQHYLVVFLDHLGQRKFLRQISGLPSNDAEKQKFISQIKETFGKVSVLRNSFKQFFEGAKSYQTNVDLVPTELRDEFVESQKSDAYFYGMSDSIIIAVPLMSADENCTAINGVYSAFAATCGIELLSLSAGVVIRGGLDVGIATPIEDKEIYGPGFERAYYIESQLAEYPRFVVGQELMNYIMWVENEPCSTRLGLVAKEIARFCKNMIIRDTDGRYMLDYLGAKAKEVAGESIDSEIVNNAFSFVKSQYEKFSNEDNEKLAARYYRFLNYFNSRLSMWDSKSQ